MRCDHPALPQTTLNFPGCPSQDVLVDLFLQNAPKSSGFATFQALTLTKILAMKARSMISASLAPALVVEVAGCGRESGDARACASFRKHAETGGDGTTKALKETIDTVLVTASSQETIDAAIDIKVQSH